MRFIFVLLLLVTITGCKSFNKSYLIINETTNNATKEHSETKTTEATKFIQYANSEEDVVHKNSEVLKNAKCSVYVLPEIDETPRLPIDELNHISKEDLAAFSHLEKEHILELREYIITLKKSVHDTYHEYINTCLSEQKKK